MPTIQIGCLGNFGRFGNQLFQYAFARGYAEAMGATLETPPWIGRALFNLNDRLITRPLTTLGVDEHPNGRVDVNLWGYFQYADCFKFYTLSKLREWFKFQPSITQFFPKAGFTVAAHIRRGDYLTQHRDVFCTIEDEAYIKAMQEAGYDPAACTFVREDSPTPYAVPGLEFLPDFLKLCNADVLFRANSTFSWWAGTLGHTTRVFSPIVEGLKGSHKDVRFVEGNHPRCVDLPNVHDYIIAP